MKNVIFLLLAMACFNMLSAQINSYTTPTKTSKDILKKLPKQVQEDFWKEAVFSEGIIISTRIKEVKSKLSKADFSILITSIGMSDCFEGYSCFPPDCMSASGYICCPHACENRDSYTTIDFGEEIPQNTKSKFYSSIVMSKGKIKTANYQILKPYLSSRKYKALAKHMKN